jgi:hypothetical protein
MIGGMRDLSAPMPSRKVRKVIFPALPREILVECLVKHELPRRHALQWMETPQMVVSAQMFYFDCIEAEHGDKEAQERVDYCREQWQLLRKGEHALGNDPEVGVKKKTSLVLPHDFKI